MKKKWEAVFLCGLILFCSACGINQNEPESVINSSLPTWLRIENAESEIATDENGEVPSYLYINDKLYWPGTYAEMTDHLVAVMSGEYILYGETISCKNKVPSYDCEIYRIDSGYEIFYNAESDTAYIDIETDGTRIYFAHNGN